jgi:hypothetical protein
MDKFKVGDTVRMKDTVHNRDNPNYKHMVGKTYTVHDISGDLIYVEADGRAKSKGIFDTRFELVSSEGIYVLILKGHDGLLKPANNPRTYSSEAQAKAVAASMAEKHPGQEFLIFKAVGKAMTKAAVVEMF